MARFKVSRSGWWMVVEADDREEVRLNLEQVLCLDVKRWDGDELVAMVYGAEVSFGVEEVLLDGSDA